MSRYHKDRDDKGVAKSGAGPYSRSYPKTTDKAPPGMSKRYPEPQGPWAEFYKTPGAAPRVQDLIRGKDISARVFSTGNRNYGLSAPVSSNKRPGHKAGPTSGEGIDSPDSVQFRKGKDYR
jgi:hypothetical protein